MCHRRSSVAGCDGERGPEWRDAGRPTGPTAARMAERAATMSLETMELSLPLLVERLVPSESYVGVARRKPDSAAATTSTGRMNSKTNVPNYVARLS
jgi:hypothetical protein